MAIKKSKRRILDSTLSSPAGSVIPDEIFREHIIPFIGDAQSLLNVSQVSKEFRKRADERSWFILQSEIFQQKSCNSY